MARRSPPALMAPARMARPASTDTPPRERTPSAMRSSTAATFSRIGRRRRKVTLRNSATRASCTSCSTASSMRAEARRLWGASSSTPGSTRRKKLMDMLDQSTARRLVTTSSTGTPCRSKVRRVPTPAPRSSAKRSSMETSATPSSWNQRPASSSLVGGRSGRQVRRCSRVSTQRARPRSPRSSAISRTGRPSTWERRAMVTGVESTLRPPCSASRSWTPGHWSVCTSTRKTVGASSGRPSPSSSLRRPSTRTIETTTCTPRPRATTVAMVPAPGRARAASPWRR